MKCIRITAMLVLAASLALSSAAAWAQDEGGEMDAAMMKMMMPGKAHEGMAKMVGAWKASTKMWMEPGEPQVSEGTTVYESILGGRYIQGHYKGSFMGQPFEGMSLAGYDNAKEQYFSLWFDTAGTGYYLSHGSASDDGKTFTYHGSMFDPSLGKEVDTKETIKIIDDNKHIFTMYVVGEEGEHKVMEITYTRA